MLDENVEAVNKDPVGKEKELSKNDIPVAVKNQMFSFFILR